MLFDLPVIDVIMNKQNKQVSYFYYKPVLVVLAMDCYPKLLLASDAASCNKLEFWSLYYKRNPA